MEGAYQRLKLDFEEVTAELVFPEGPIALADGRVLLVEIGGKALTCVEADGTVRRIAQLEGGPNGAAIGPDGACYICNSGGWLHQQHGDFMHVSGQSKDNGWIERVCLRSGEVTRLYTECDGRPLRAPNDLVFDRQGGFYFTDHGKAGRYQRDTAAVYYAQPDGRAITEVIRPLLTANGIGLSPDGAMLYVAETQSRRLWRFTISRPGVIDPAPFPSVTGGHLVAGLPDRFALDSLAVDSAGHIAVGSIGSGGVWDLSPTGAERVLYTFPDPYVTNICFGGEDLRTAFATLSGGGRLVRFRWPRAGLRLAFEGELRL